MDPITILQEFGVPIAVACAFAWYIMQQKKSLDAQNKYIQDDLTKDLHNKFNRLEQIINDDLRQIIIGLINAQKKHTVGLKGLEKSYESLVKIITKLSGNGLKDKFK